MRFFFSYAHAAEDADGRLSHFYNDLDEEVRFLSGMKEPCGFLDKTIRTGEHWPESLRGGLEICHVMVCLYSPAYFRSVHCGKEMAVYVQRQKPEPAPRLIFPVHWLPHRIPNELDHIQMADYKSQVYRTDGLLALMQRGGRSGPYRTIVRGLAKDVYAACGQLPINAKPLRVPSYRSIHPAFAVSEGDAIQGKAEELLYKEVISMGQPDDKKRVRAVAAANGGRVISASADGTLSVWMMGAKKPQYTLKGHASEVRDVAISKDGRKAISASFDNTLKLWRLDIDRGCELGTLNGHWHWVRAVALSDDEKTAVSGSAEPRLMIWDLTKLKVWYPDQQKPLAISAHQNYINAVALSKDQKFLISASDDKTLHVRDFANGQHLVTSLKGHKDEVLDIATIDGERLISASFDKTLKVWQLKSGKLLMTLDGHEDAIRSVAVTPNGRYAISASFDKTVRVWDLQSYRATRVIRGDDAFTACAVSVDGKTVIAGDHAGRVHFFSDCGI